MTDPAVRPVLGGEEAHGLADHPPLAASGPGWTLMRDCPLPPEGTLPATRIPLVLANPGLGIAQAGIPP